MALPVQKQQPADLSLNKYSLEYAFEELQRATRDFEVSCKLGSGAFGAVYRGTQSDGTDVAVKVLDAPEGGGFEEEVRVLSKFRHPNLVILMGFARNGAQRFLVYEFLGGGDVCRRLQRSNSEDFAFPWRERVGAAFGAACGLSHLHNASPKVFHRDIKSANILLDGNGTAKMADFGIACLSHTKAQVVQHASGTVGYSCPLYTHRRVVTEGSEVYSFGIVLLELLTALTPVSIARGPEGEGSCRFLVEQIQGEVRRALSLADAEAHWPRQVAASLAHLALRCTGLTEERPGFTKVVKALRRLRNVEEGTPQQPLRIAQSTVGAAPGAGPALVSIAKANLQAGSSVPDHSVAHNERPTLWTLECIFAEGSRDLESLAREQRTLVHRQEPGTPLLTLLKVGRLAQADFFNAVLADEGTRNMVSREHFCIWAVHFDAAGPVPAVCDAVPCSFFLRNLSRGWTRVNGVHLEHDAPCVSLHAGDRIALGRKLVTPAGVSYVSFLEFSFDLVGSILQDVAISQHPNPRL